MAQLNDREQELVDDMVTEEGSLYDDYITNLAGLVETLREREESLENAQDAQGTEEVVTDVEVTTAKERCDEAAGELATALANIRVCCHNIALYAEELEEETLADYTITDAK